MEERPSISRNLLSTYDMCIKMCVCEGEYEEGEEN